MGASKQDAFLNMEERIERIQSLADYQNGFELTLEYIGNRLRGNYDHQLISQTMNEMHARGLVTKGIRVVGAGRYRTYTRRSRQVTLKRTFSNDVIRDHIPDRLGLVP